MLSGFAISAPKTTIAERDAEFDALTPEEQEIVYRDLYGTGNYSIQEDDHVLEDGLLRFEQHLSEIPDDDTKQSYLMALERSPDYVNDKNFRLQFLRCELFDPKLAARRFLRYWNEKLKIWGEAKAFHKITLDDFDEEDMVVLRKGLYYALTKGDKFQRGIVIANRIRYDKRYPNSTARAMWYTMEYLVERVEVQRHGIVGCAGLLPETLLHENRKLDYILVNLVQCALPVRVVAIHHIASSRFVEYIIPYLLFLIGSNWRYRFKMHYARNTALKEMETYGIPKKIIPKELGGDDDLFDFNDWLEKRKKEEIDRKHNE